MSGATPQRDDRNAFLHVKKRLTTPFILLAFLPVLLILGFYGWSGWFLWAFMAGLWGIGHPPIMDPQVPLGRNRTIVGWIAFAVFVVTFAPVPFSFH